MITSTTRDFVSPWISHLYSKPNAEPRWLLDHFRIIPTSFSTKKQQKQSKDTAVFIKVTAMIFLLLPLLQFQLFDNLEHQLSDHVVSILN